MYTVVKIEIMQGGRGRARIVPDGAPPFPLYQSEIRAYGLEEGAAIPDEAYREIMETLLPKRARLRAMRLLEKRPYTEQALRTKLSDGYYPEEVIDEAIGYVKSFGYINDLQYAIDHVSYHIADRNRKRLEIDLLKKGVAREVIREAFETCYTEEEYRADGSGDGGLNASSGQSRFSARAYEEQMIRKALSKKRFNPETADYETKAKIKASLIRKGFSPEIVSDVVN